MLPPGRARLPIKPRPTGSVTCTNTTGTGPTHTVKGVKVWLKRLADSGVQDAAAFPDALNSMLSVRDASNFAVCSQGYQPCHQTAIVTNTVTFQGGSSAQTGKVISVTVGGGDANLMLMSGGKATYSGVI